MQTRQYKNFSLRLHNKGLKKPILGQFELTHRCNLRCQHCYILNDPKRKELTYSEFCRIIDDVYEEGCLWLCFTGGEPMMREDFLDIYTYAYKKGFVLTIFTNATLLNEQIARHLKRFPPFCIESTLNGTTKKTYELISQTPDSFEKAMRGIDLIRSYGLPLKLKCQVMTLNIDEMPLICRFYKKMSLEFRCSGLIDPRMDGSTEPCSLRLPINKILELYNTKKAMKRKGGLEGVFSRKASFSDNLFRCPVGISAFYINPFGELFFCNSMRKLSWDLRKHSFRQGFYGFFTEIRSMKFKTNSPCRTCSLKGICMWCPGRAYLETGDMEKPISYYCELARLERSIGHKDDRRKDGSGNKRNA